ncbi:MAG: glycosyltransferase [Niabella sp.]
MTKSSSILFILPYPVNKAPSQRFRVEQFLPLLQHENIAYKLATFMDEKTWDLLYKGGSSFQKAIGIIKGYLKRWKHVLVDVHKYNIVFVHREAAPLGPPIFEWIITKLWRKKMVYDFDDAIWIPNTSTENKMMGYFKAFWKVGKICKLSTIVTAGNHFLADFARNSGASHVEYLPTVVDTERRYIPENPKTENHTPVIGWTGSHSTLKYLDEILPVLNELNKEVEFTFLVIADKDPQLPLKNYKFVNWNADTEIEDLQKIDVGIMPLTADKWSEGKCGFKLIQYMALGIPAVASPVGVNKGIIKNGVSGFLCNTYSEWGEKLQLLLADRELREQMSKLSINTIKESYSICSIKGKLMTILRND